jgi:hypothetical protein
MRNSRVSNHFSVVFVWEAAEAAGAASLAMDVPFWFTLGSNFDPFYRLKRPASQAINGVGYLV